ncbi:hypothetical protein Cni_G08211 [Canna indica]|uniref:Protein TIFY n=1 Tax=Canna indica TaxID=4628 RepID=A0AAQ3JZW1_9LILI|nr:hypothetical protein Cni_G08211 [Canna indica]
MAGISSEPDLRLRLGSGADDGGSAKQQQQQITILYNGRICVCRVTEQQARAIISMAKQEMGGVVDDDQIMGGKKKEEQQGQLEQQVAAAVSPPVERQLLVNGQLSMKRSLQRFLQKRKSRSDAISAPYANHRRPQHLFSVKS